jgi:hypothetical protein
MATTTRAVLRQRLSELIGDYQSLTCTSDGNSAATTLISTGLLNLENGGDTDAFEGWYVYITSGGNSGEERRVSSYAPADVSAPTITVEQAFSNAVDGSGADAVTFELHRHRPTYKHNALSRAIEEVCRQIPQVIRDETLVVDNLLSNSDFETYEGSDFTSWTSSGSPTLVQETSRMMHGSNSASIAASGAAGQITQAVVANFNQISNRQLSFECWVYATTADTARVRVHWGGSDYENHDYHDGTDEWQLQSLQVTVPSDSTALTIICEVADGYTAYFDNAWAAIDPLYKYTIPSSITYGPVYVSQQADRHCPTGAYHMVAKNSTPSKGRLLRLEGLGILSRPTSDTATVEIGAPFLAPIISYAAMFLFRLVMVNSVGQQLSPYNDQMRMWGQEAGSLISELRRPKMGAKRSDNTWHIEEDSSGRYLVFDRSR